MPVSLQSVVIHEAYAVVASYLWCEYNFGQLENSLLALGTKRFGL